jgi:uncharacterized membrane protein
MPTAGSFLNAQEQKAILEAISAAEKRTSGEIRVHLENFCPGNEVKAAIKVFTGLGMHRTAERNGVLIYIATMSRKIAIVGDQGIHDKLGLQYWEKLVEHLIQQFKARHQAEALIACIGELAEKLHAYFPGRHDDRDELTNEISFGK